MNLPPLTPSAWLRFDVVSRLLDSMDGVERIVEIGAGKGAVGTRLAHRYPAYIGVEPDERASRVARERIASLNRTGSTIVDSLDSIPTPARFDLVCAFEVLEHIEDDAGALKQWRSHLKPEGWLLLSVPAYQKRFAAADSLVGHFRRYDPEVILRLVLESGFIDPVVYMYGFPLGHLLEFGRNVLARREGHAPTSIEQRTAASGRWLQPSKRTALLTQGVTAPFRILQRPFLRTRFGSGLILRARNRS